MRPVLSIVKKDIALMARDRLTVVITLLALFAYSGIYYLMPSEIDETFKLGLHLAQGRAEVEERLKQESGSGLEIVWADSETALKTLVEDREVAAGFSLTQRQEEPRVRLYVSSQTPAEIADQGEALGKEAAFALLGQELPLEVEETVIGDDLLGNQTSVRDKFRVLFLVFVFIVEIYTLANLLVDEIAKKTVTAILATPATIGRFLTAKAVVGVGVTFVEAFALALVLRVMTLDTLVPISILLALAALLVTGVAFLVGAVGRDMFTVMLWLILAMIILAAPAAALTAPAITSAWVKAIPTYFFVDALDGVVNRGFTPVDYIDNIAYLAGSAIVSFGLGLTVLRRRVALA